MRTLILTALLAAVALFSTTAVAQAALETLMTHSTSSAVATHAGTALGNAVNRAAGNVAHQTATSAGRVITVPQTASSRRTAARAGSTNAVTPAPVSGPVSSNGSLIASIQGGEPRSASKNAKACATAAAAGANCAATLQTPDHPAVVNLPPAK